MIIQKEVMWSIDAFEPAISAETMAVHVYQLHKRYIDKLNYKFGSSGILSIPPSEILSDIDGYLSSDLQDFYRNQMGGHVTHTLFWQILNPMAVNDGYEDLSLFRDYNLTIDSVISGIKKEAASRFGSGWVWGALTRNGDFKIYSTKNHDTPYMRKNVPLFCVDLWEHAYFLDKQGFRKEWIDSVIPFIDFYTIDRIYKNHMKGVDLIDRWCLNL